jgi:hypothetical protein
VLAGDLLPASGMLLASRGCQVTATLVERADPSAT